MHVHLVRALAAGLVAAAPLAAAAQGGATSFGLTGSAFSWEDGRREQALGAVFQLQPTPWLVLGATPAMLRAEVPGTGESRVGFADLPVYAGVVHASAEGLRPMMAVSASASFPTGDEDRGLGRGVTLVGGDAVLGFSPLTALTLRGGASRLLLVDGEAPSGGSTTALFGDVVLATGLRTNLSVGMAAELQGDAPSGYETMRALNAALVHTLSSGASLVLGAGHSLRGNGPDWSFSIGLGTAFGGVAPIGATSPAARTTGGLARPGTGPLGAVRPPLCGVTGGC